MDFCVHSQFDHSPFFVHRNVSPPQQFSCSVSTWLHSATSQKTVIFIF